MQTSAQICELKVEAVLSVLFILNFAKRKASRVKRRAAAAGMQDSDYQRAVWETLLSESEEMTLWCLYARAWTSATENRKDV